jgi:hypothetical protein
MPATGTKKGVAVRAKPHAVKEKTLKRKRQQDDLEKLKKAIDELVSQKMNTCYCCFPFLFLTLRYDCDRTPNLRA